MGMDGMKKCTKCKIKKQKKDFVRDKKMSDGLTSACKKCRYAQWNKANKRRKSTLPKAKSKLSKDLTRVFVIPDCHIPWHHKTAFSVMINALRHFKPDHVVILGDFGDFYNVSRHMKSPTKALRFVDEIAKVKEHLEIVKDAAGGAKLTFCCGNHEVRLEALLKNGAPQIFELIKVPDLLGLKDLGFDYVPYGSYLKIGKMVFTHDIGHHGETAHKTSLRKAGMSINIGHTHRMAMVIEKTLEGNNVITGATLGWLGDESAMTEYMPTVKIQRYAIHGFGLAYVFRDGTPVVVPTPIVDGKCVVEGEVIDANQRTRGNRNRVD